MFALFALYGSAKALSQSLANYDALRPALPDYALREARVRLWPSYSGDRGQTTLPSPEVLDACAAANVATLLRQVARFGDGVVTTVRTDNDALFMYKGMSTMQLQASKRWGLR